MTSDTISESDTSDRRADLYVRSLSYPAAYSQQECLVDRLSELERDGVISGFDLHVWGKQLVLSEAVARTETGRRLLDRFNRFHQWAEAYSRPIGSFFEFKEIQSELTGDEYTAVVFPVAVLAEYVDDELVFVAPCSVDGAVCSIDDRLDDLAAGRTDTVEPLGETVNAEL